MPQENNQSPKDELTKQQEFIKKVAERVWQLWQQELRRNRERNGKQHGSKR